MESDLFFSIVYAHLGDIVGSAPDYLSKVDITIKQDTWVYLIFQLHIKVILTLYNSILSMQYHMSFKKTMHVPQHWNLHRHT